MRYCSESPSPRGWAQRLCLCVAVVVVIAAIAVGIQQSGRPAFIVEGATNLYRALSSIEWKLGDESLFPKKPLTREEAFAAILPRLEKAEADSMDARKRALARVINFINERKQGAQAFADDVLGWGAKYAVVDDFMGNANNKLNEMLGIKARGYNTSNLSTLVKESFARNVLEQSQLQDIVRYATAGYVSEVQAIESRLLVEIRADLSDESLATQIPELRTESLLQDRYDILLRDLAATSSADVAVKLGREMIAWKGGNLIVPVATQIAGTIATELGLSGGILCAGAASSVATFGVGLAVSWVIDQILNEILKIVGLDSETEIVAKIQAALDETCDLIISGPSTGVGVGGLQYKLHELHDGRTKLRNAAIKTLILEGGAP